jgi:hypothetical protein
MPHDAQPLAFHPFGSGALSTSAASPQVDYLRRYLGDMGASSVVEEPQYFDRDFLSEFTAFYGTSCTGYANTCRRLHFFSVDVTRETFIDALGDADRADAIQEAYLGFVVLRPIPGSPLGRTVLAYYPDRAPSVPRVTTPSRPYRVCVAGLCLGIRGLAWQQQDTAVGACATIALWSMLHSSGFEGLHRIPTTADVTRAAHVTAPFGKRVFPSSGMNVFELCGAIKAHGLSPVVIPGDEHGEHIGFDRERFCASCASLIRSGFPLIITTEDHAVCAVGFRSSTNGPVDPGDVLHNDEGIPVVYIHDDNIGPSVRFKLDTHEDGYVVLTPEAPEGLKATELPDPTDEWDSLRPTNLIVALPSDIRTSPDALHGRGFLVALHLSRIIESAAQTSNATTEGLTFSTKFVRLREYLSSSLHAALHDQPEKLGAVRLSLAEDVRPMSLYLGVVRIGVGSHTSPKLDVLFDTTDSDLNHPAFAHVVYDQSISPYVEACARVVPMGTLVDAT